MRKNGSAAIPVLICGLMFLYSCAGTPPAADLPVVDQPTADRPTVPETPPPVSAGGIPERPAPPETIMGQGTVPWEKLAAFLLAHNTQVRDRFAGALAAYYVEEAAAEGVNHDTAFAQMCLETGFLRYGGLVTPDMNNFCGLGAIGPEQPGLIFPDPRSGVRAHIQHLKAYASTEPLNQDLIDPRFRYVQRGSAPTIHGLAGTWAADKAYSGKISAILRRLYEFSL